MTTLLVSVAANARDKFEKDGVTYEVTISAIINNVILTDGKSVVPLNGEFTIPNEVEHNGVWYTVTDIESVAFFGNTSLRSVTIPASVERIGIRIFGGCTNLTEIKV